MKIIAIRPHEREALTQAVLALRTLSNMTAQNTPSYSAKVLTWSKALDDILERLEP